MTQTQTFVTTTVGAIAAFVAGLLCYTNPPILNLPSPFGMVLMVAGLVAFGIQVRTGFTATQVAQAVQDGFEVEA